MYELSNINYMQKINLSEEDQPPSTLRALISPHLKRLIKSSPALFKEFVPSTKENQSEIQVFSDPLCEEKFIKTKGLVHKYPGRVLIEMTMQCSSYCRFCTRRRKVSDIEHGKLSGLDIANIIEYLQNHHDVTEVVISGGDPFTAPKQLVQFIKSIDRIQTIKIIRIHTRVPVSFPQSIPDYIYSALSKVRKTLYLSIHFEHPDELTKPTLAAVKKLRKTGAILLSQSVFLKEVNDDYEILYELFTKLSQLGIRPYYIYRCDPVAGAAHFIVPFEKEIEIMTKLRKNLSGIAFPTYVIDTANGSGKIPVPLGFWEFEKNWHLDFNKKKTIIF